MRSFGLGEITEGESVGRSGVHMDGGPEGHLLRTIQRDGYRFAANWETRLQNGDIRREARYLLIPRKLFLKYISAQGR